MEITCDPSVGVDPALYDKAIEIISDTILALKAKNTSTIGPKLSKDIDPVLEALYEELEILQSFDGTISTDQEQSLVSKMNICSTVLSNCTHLTLGLLLHVLSKTSRFQPART